MSVLIFIAGLAIGISAFLYILSAISGGMNKIKKTGTGQSKVTKQNIQPETIGFRGRKTVPPGTRICPLCGSELTKYEGLYASKVMEKSENKILIMGCKYCFKDK
ncbi:MAG TPA: hypothetical protein PKG60_13560 [Spirochaetota bacterium]|nr:hypothetical protein [Spirochaetota bacterium]HPS85152.1 hypothetical protein [Spirochaetota bacterium]